MKRVLLATTAILGIMASALPAYSQSLADASDAGGTNSVKHAKDDKIEAVTVTGKRKVDPADGGAFGARSVLDTPYSVAVATSEDLLDRQVTSLGQVFENDASVNQAGNTYTFHNNHINVRGLQLDEANSYKIDGLSVFAFSVELPLEAFEQVELLKGATGFQYGFGSPGGIVNYVTKKPTDKTFTSVDFGYHQDSLFTAHVDTGGRFGAGDIFGYRFNVAAERGEAYNGTQVNRTVVTGSLDAKLLPSLTWTGDLLYQERNTKGQVQGFGTAFLSGPSLPSVIEGDKELPASNGTFLNTKFFLARTGLAWDIAQDWKARVDYSYSDKLSWFAADWFYPTNANWDYVDYINASRSVAEVNQVQGVVEGTIETGPLKHEIVVGAAIQRQTNDSTTNMIWGLLGTGNLYSGQRLTYNPITFHPYRTSDYTQRSIFLSDTVDLFTPEVQLLAGFRYTDYEQNGYDTTGAVASSYKNDPITPTVALLYKPWTDTTFYASYVEAVEPGTTVGATYANANETLAPLLSRQYEAGFKYEGRRWGGNVALFRIERGAAYVNASNYYVQNGQVRYQGLELCGYLALTDDLKVSASTTFLDASYRKGDVSVAGNRAEGAPRFQAVADIDYRVVALPGLSLNLGSRINGNEAIDSANAYILPGYTLFHAGARYDTTISDRAVSFRLTLDNLGGKRYFYYVQPGYFYAGDPRLVSFNVQFGL